MADNKQQVTLYDTTLRDGAQAEDVNFSVDDKIHILELLDDLGVHYVEGGWPGSNPKDEEFFKRVRRKTLKNAKIAAFGMTARPGVKPDNDVQIARLLSAETPVVTVFGKTWDFHVDVALKTTLQKNVDMIHATIEYLSTRADEVIFDAEHFFDGYKENPEFTLECIKAAADAGAEYLVLCDTNGGSIPSEVAEIVAAVKAKYPETRVGVHVHNDSDMAVANSILAVQAGAQQVQGTINGYGERCGNANLVSIIANLNLKLGIEAITPEQLTRLTWVSRSIDEIGNLKQSKRQPFVGRSAFAHKGGVHVSAVARNARTYEHMDPVIVGNERRVLVSELSGRSNVLFKAEELGLDLDSKSEAIAKVVDQIKELESFGYQFEGAEGSFELLVKRAKDELPNFFDLVAYRVIVERRDGDPEAITEATVRVRLPDGRIVHEAAMGNGPVSALDKALRTALQNYAQLQNFELNDFKVRVLPAMENHGAESRVRVLIESSDGESAWGTVGVSENIIEASWQALRDSIEYRLLKDVNRDATDRKTQSN